MDMGHIARRLTTIAAVVAFFATARGQSIVQMNMPGDICVSRPTTVTIGYNDTNTAVIFTAQATLGHSERIFLPDGRSCAPYGCAYRSPVVFDAFAQNARITSVNDIQYVRLNIEHSYIGDIYIGLECPNGSTVSLMNWSGGGSSDCTGSVPSDARGWSGSTVGTGSYFGNAHDGEGSPACDSTADGNEAGTGWNYCWSENTVSNYQYAAGDGLIYRSGNSTNYSIDSSNVAAGTNFYHPNHSFNNLIGCPLNGEWAIVVVDAWSGDNGYVFDWELSLNSALVPVQCEVVSRQVIGPWTQRINDSTFRINWPQTIHRDTTVDYTFRLTSSCNTTYDTTVSVRLHPTYNTTEEVRGCNSVSWHGQTFTQSATRVQHLQSRYGCDSTATVDIVVQNRVFTTVYDTVVQNRLPYTWNGQTLTAEGSRTVTLTSSTGCDSVVTLHLKVWPNVQAAANRTVCESALPVEWNGVSFNASGTRQVLLATTHGADSLLTMTLEVIPTVRNTVHDTVVQNNLPHTFGGRAFARDVTDTLFRRTGARGCDSLVTYSLKVWWNKQTERDTTLCDNHLPVAFNGHTFSAAGTMVDHLHTSHGADSTVTTTLLTNPAYAIGIAASICDNERYTFEGSTYTVAGSYAVPFTTTAGCDSVRTLTLAVRPTTAGDTVANECDHFAWYGTDYTAPGNVATRTTTNSVGCDSTTTLRLTLRHRSASAYRDTVVQNQLPRAFNNRTFSDSVSHATVTISNAAGCDSVIDYSLHVWWNRDTVVDSAVCNSRLPLVWAQGTGAATVVATLDTTVGTTATLQRRVVIPTTKGADSTITMRLTVWPLYDHHTNATICNRQWVQNSGWDTLGYRFGDSLFSGADGSTVHLDSLLSVHGCDSLSTLHLTVMPTYYHRAYDTVCSNVAYRWGTPLRTVMPARSTAGGYQAPIDTAFTDRLHTAAGNCDSLSTLHLRVLAAYDIHIADTICADSTLRFENVSHSATGNYPFQLSTATGNGVPRACDSVRTLHLKVYPTYDQHLRDTIYDGDTYRFEGTTYDTTGTYPHMLRAVFGCDSLRTLHLQRNRRTYVDSTICQNSLPLTWHHVRRSDTIATYVPQAVDVVFVNGMGARQGHMQTIRDSVHLLGRHDIDSLVVMTLTVRDTSATYDVQHACDSLTWRNGITYRQGTEAPFVVLVNHLGCDSVRHLTLTVDYTHHYTDRLLACDSLTWRNGTTYHRDTVGTVGAVGSRRAVGPVDTTVTVGGCDSVISLDLSVHYSTYGATADTFCYNQTYAWHGFEVRSDSAYSTVDYYLTDTLKTVWQCDSVVGLLLTQMAKPKIGLGYEIDCGHLAYTLNADVDVGYTVWTSLDPTLEGQELERSIVVMPRETTTYYMYADYHEDPLCPLTDSIRLAPVVIPKAEMRVNPGVLTYNNLDFNAYDLSRGTKARHWYVDHEMLWDTSSHLVGSASADVDSMHLALSVYNGQCWDTTMQLVPIRKVAIYAPNAFTPAASENNRFALVTKGVVEGELVVYNREGMEVYRTRDFGGAGWDGAGTPQGNYVWVLRYRSLDRKDTWQTTSGSVIIIR